MSRRAALPALLCAAALMQGASAWPWSASTVVAAGSPAATLAEAAFTPVHKAEGDTVVVAAAESASALSFASYTCNMTMKLACVVTLDINRRSLGSDSMAVSLRYYPEHSSNQGLWTAPLWVDSSERTLDVSVFRLRPNTRYIVEAYAQKSSEEYGSPAPLARHTIMSLASGYDFMDMQGVATVVSGSPSFNVMMFDIESDDFKGVVMIDSEGYPVWYHDAGCQVLAFDQYADYRFVVNAFPHNGGMSALGMVTPAGDQIDSYSCSCVGHGSNWTQLNHEVGRENRTQEDVRRSVSHLWRALAR